ncbi:carboxylesterase/lipase family protein [Antrihabitans stalactiti]|uniref:Carboxylic ester hydrolase n=1 Tax=Antrihabitans stalactiti TaxID=2584121 RepID=A0A848KHK3_9NOCA|nr:carboxylesterase/lipase family protein [Antrihabitans stalactiti]NMN96544.1 carboxylesterase/lipase family protein [Antrihabitans stalactiti]
MSGPAVEIASGVVVGKVVDGLCAWRGIPYAATPIGDLRFRGPQPVKAWDGPLDAKEFGPKAPQVGVADSSEDCLTINVLAPQATSDQPRPVLVFIHGGAYVTGSSAEPLYRGDNLVRTGGIVYVSFNYRLGALGYLDFTEYSTAERTFETNVGLRDQVAALEWIQRNIAAFGGDPDNVTVWGQSSGANAVTTLMCTPAARGLFARAIAASSPVASAYGKDRARGWAAQFVSSIAPDGDAVRALTTASPMELANATQTLTQRLADEEPGTRITAPVVDGDYLPQYPIDAFADGNAAPIPLLIGSTSHEGRFFPLFLNIIPSSHKRIEKMFDETDPAVKARALASYPGYPRRRAAADLGGDIVFWEPSILCAQGHTKYARTYCYRYDFAPRLLHAIGLSATHGTDLFATFGALGDGLGRHTTLLGGRSAMRAVSDTMTAHWLSFVRHGSPQSSWPTYSLDRRETMIFDEVSQVRDDPLGERRRAWIGYHHKR